MILKIVKIINSSISIHNKLLLSLLLITKLTFAESDLDSINNSQDDVKQLKIGNLM